MGSELSMHAGRQLKSLPQSRQEALRQHKHRDGGTESARGDQQMAAEQLRAAHSSMVVGTGSEMRGWINQMSVDSVNMHRPKADDLMPKQRDDLALPKVGTQPFDQHPRATVLEPLARSEYDMGDGTRPTGNFPMVAQHRRDDLTRLGSRTTRDPDSHWLPDGLPSILAANSNVSTGHGTGGLVGSTATANGHGTAGLMGNTAAAGMVHGSAILDTPAALPRRGAQPLLSQGNMERQGFVSALASNVPVRAVDRTVDVSVGDYGRLRDQAADEASMRMFGNTVARANGGAGTVPLSQREASATFHQRQELIQMARDQRFAMLNTGSWAPDARTALGAGSVLPTTTGRSGSKPAVRESDQLVARTSAAISAMHGGLERVPRTQVQTGRRRGGLGEAVIGSSSAAAPRMTVGMPSTSAVARTSAVPATRGPVDPPWASLHDRSIRGAYGGMLPTVAPVRPEANMQRPRRRRDEAAGSFGLGTVTDAAQNDSGANVRAILA